MPVHARSDDGDPGEGRRTQGGGIGGRSRTPPHLQEQTDEGTRNVKRGRGVEMRGGQGLELLPV